ncbi:WXG100 family type VII secretion target [Prauserella muralis]|uniref:Uncharacterized protein n=1 Tax=Prauserella muralis TaxID=588067 RepID=A0A2V4B2B6_9PSEU|nr:hypothetical protein [Prauserella muralis]PXY27538.1 hypothetical protein BAY60_14085 [Prauserella muralis]TWE22739.1 hypothetical protein FHX69_3990 [Prauserella muralis]
MVDTAGAGIVDTVATAVKDLDNPSDWAMDGVALGLDVLGLVANPLGGLLSAGIGWLIEHLDFLKEPLDDLAGDPAAINRVAAVWGEQIRSDVAQIADEYEKALSSEITSWTGDAAEQYRTTADQIVQQIRSLEGASTAVSNAVQGSGVLVATVRGIIRDLIAQVVSEIIIAAAAALATSWCSFGASIAAFTGWAVARGAATAGKIAGKISKLLMKLATILNKFGRLRGAVQALAKASRKFGDTAKSLGQIAGRNGQMFRQVQGAADGWTGALKNALPDGVGNVVGKVDDAMAKITKDGFSDTFSAANYGRISAYEAAKEQANADENYQDAKDKLADEPK